MGRSHFLPSATLKAMFLALFAMWILPEPALAKHARVTRHYKFNVCCAFEFKLMMMIVTNICDSLYMFIFYYRLGWKMLQDCVKLRALWPSMDNFRDLESSRGKVIASWSKWLTMSSTMSPFIGTKCWPSFSLNLSLIMMTRFRIH